MKNGMRRGVVDLNDPIVLKRKPPQPGEFNVRNGREAAEDKAKFCSQGGFKLAA